METISSFFEFECADRYFSSLSDEELVEMRKCIKLIEKVIQILRFNNEHLRKEFGQIDSSNYYEVLRNLAIRKLDLISADPNSDDFMSSLEAKIKQLDPNKLSRFSPLKKRILKGLVEFDVVRAEEKAIYFEAFKKALEIRGNLSELARNFIENHSHRKTNAWGM